MKDMNCVWLNAQNPYDVLCKLQTAVPVGRDGPVYCILDHIRFEVKRNCHPDGCKKCIENWMLEGGLR